MSEFEYHKFLQKIVDEDVRFIIEREKTYKGSWQKAGGRSAWFMIRRKLDRLIEMMKRPPEPHNFKDKLYSAKPSWQEEVFRYLYACYMSEDIFAKIEENPSGRDSTVLAEI